MAFTPLESLQSIWPPSRWRDVTVVVGVSGGADSVALLHLLSELATQNSHPGTLVVAHYNHRLRGNESDRDEAFVCELAAHLKIECIVEQAAPFMRSDRTGPSQAGGETVADRESFLSESEETWRNQRYAFLSRVANRVGARYVALAHHSDDRLETIMHHLLRGTGISGLASLKPFRSLGEEVVMARPLLHADRATIREYLAQSGLLFREDQSNSNNRFTRNRIRNQLLPYLSELGFVQHRAALLRLADQAHEMDEWLDRLVDDVYDQIVSPQGDGASLCCGQMNELARPVQRHLLARLWYRKGWPMGAMNAPAWNRLLALISGVANDDQGGHLPGGISVKRMGEQLQLTPR